MQYRLQIRRIDNRRCGRMGVAHKLSAEEVVVSCAEAERILIRPVRHSVCDCSRMSSKKLASRAMFEI